MIEFYNLSFIFIVYIQFLIWIILYYLKWDIEDLRYYFYFFCMIAFLVFNMKKTEIYPYSNILLLQYIFYIFICVFYYDRKYENFKDALCFGMLIVFFNSYYWELPIHLMELINKGKITSRFIFQSLHFIPFPFLLNWFKLGYDIEIRNFKDYILKYIDELYKFLSGFLLTFFIVIIRFEYLREYIIFNIAFNNFLGNSLLILNRFICLLLLMSIFKEKK